jgi:5'-nucleotidase
MRTRIVLVIFAALIGPGFALQAIADEPASLRILLTNDDGYDKPGIKAVHQALVAAGHDVTLIAPRTDQSGSGMRVTTQGTLDYRQHSEGIWSVDASPADAVLVGLLHIMQDQPPELVVSGANFGPNLGFASSSGTVGAATMAMHVGIPAIAISVGINPAEYAATPLPFPSTFAAFDGAAGFAVDLIRDLHETRGQGGSLMQNRAVLNVNYPPVEPEELQGVRLLQAIWDVGVRVAYHEMEEAGKLAVQLELLDAGVPADGDADWQWLSRGYITISVLDGNSDAGENLRDSMSSRLSMLEAE